MKKENVSWAVFDAMPQFIAMVRKDGTLLTVSRSEQQSASLGVFCEIGRWG